MTTNAKQCQSMLRVVEAAARTGLSPATIYRMMRSGQLRAWTVAGRARIAAEDLDELFTPVLRPANDGRKGAAE
ncbi:MAG: helix-turn-helix domain-containing protein [Deltaproteobacteria bacterium]|nr:helix-turn-helix domain-containing protein [Deltaproteobacteria bacterium]